MAGIALDCYEAGNVISMIAFFTRIGLLGVLFLLRGVMSCHGSGVVVLGALL
jgi:hypothetical protein